MNLTYANEKMEQRHESGLLRKRLELTRSIEETQYQNQSIINFASNDYLGLSCHPQVIEACQVAAGQYGVGSGASMMVSGYHFLHKQLENALAEFLQVDRVLLFPSGYMANLGVIGALAECYQQWFFDKQNHASLYDAARLNAIPLNRYHHGNYLHLQQCLLHDTTKNRCIVTEGVFSMDGHVLGVDQVNSIAEQVQSDLIIDDSHAIGVVGENGRGSLGRLKDNQKHHLVITSSFGKAFGCGGGFVAGDSVMIDYIEQYARSFIYTTALSPVLAAAALASLQLIKTEQLQKLLQDRIQYFNQIAQDSGLTVTGSQSAIQPILVKSTQQGEVLQKILLEQGILVGLMRPPTVPANQTCLRITLTAKHTKDHIEQLISILQQQRGYVK